MKKIFTAICCAAIVLGTASCLNENRQEASDDNTAEAGNETVQAQPQESVAEETVEISVPVPESSGSAEDNVRQGLEYIKALCEADSTVKVTPSGLAYKVLKPGTGDSPTLENTAQVIYTGKFLDGDVFDSSKGKAIPFPLTGVVAGFSEGLQLMNRGAVYRLYIPGELAYGPAGIPGAIGPNQMLVFDLELVDF